MYQQGNKIGRLFAGGEAGEVAGLGPDGGEELLFARPIYRCRGLAASEGPRQRGGCEKHTHCARLSGQKLTRRPMDWPIRIL
jgi:hypothetical protein